MLNETSYHGAGAIQEIAAEAKARAYKKAIGIIIANPEFEDVRSLEGTARRRNRVYPSSQCRPQQVRRLRLRSTM